MSYYQVKVQVKHEDAKGKMKNTNETYLADAMSCVDAEAKVTKLMSEGSLEFEVKEVKETKILEVI